MLTNNQHYRKSFRFWNGFIGILLLCGSLFGQSNFELGFDKVSYINHIPVDYAGLINIAYDPGAEGAFLSVGLQDATGSAFCIGVSNLFLPPAAMSPVRQQVSVPFDLLWLAPTPEQFPPQLIGYIHLFTTPQDYPYNPSTHIDTKLITVMPLVDDAMGSHLAQAPQPPQFGPNKIAGTKKGDELSEVYYYGCEVPNIDLDDSKHGDSPTYAGDKNACVPTATANSLLWMDKKYNIFLGFPPPEHDLVEQLSKAMKRANNEGTYTDKMIQGKLNYFQERNLPIDVKFQVKKDYINNDLKSSDGKSTATCMNSGDYPTWEFLKEALKEGCDVEINYVAKDQSGNAYAHSVVVTGVEDYRRAGLRYLHFKHDRRQGAEGGTRQEVSQIFVDDDGKLRIASRNQAYIRDIVVECPKKTGTGIELDETSKPTSFAQVMNYPNPFNASTTITFTLREPGDVNLRVVDARGVLVRRFDLAQQTMGEHRVVWHALSESSGVYFLILSSKSQTIRHKLLLIK